MFVTKDFGQNWTDVRIPSAPTYQRRPVPPAIATNDVSLPNYNILRTQGNYDITLTVDPIDPNITYVGGNFTALANPG